MPNRVTRKTRALSKLLLAGLVCFVCLISITLLYSFKHSIHERNERAALYTHMIESTLSRTLEAMEISLSSFSSDLSKGDLTPDELSVIRTKLLETLRFAPHLRQIVVVKDHKVLLDTRRNPPADINLPLLGLDHSTMAGYSLGLMIGTQIKGRFFPHLGKIAEESEHSEIIPIGLEITNNNREKLVIIAAFNPDYIKRYLQELPLQMRDRIFIVDFDGNSLMQHGFYGPFKREIIEQLHTALDSGKTVVQSKDQERFIPLYSVTTRLAAKYPLSVALVTDHKGSLEKWAHEMQSLFTILVMVLLTLLVGGHYALRNNYKALAMKEEVHLLSEVVEHSPTIIVITDTDGFIQYVNKSFERETGYSKGEVLGKNPKLLKSGNKTDVEYSQMWQTLLAGNSWSGEFHNKRKDGGLYWERATISPLTDSNGEITHFIALKQPIDAEKATQEQIRLASTVFDSATEAIMVTSVDNVIQMVNPAFKTITGFSAEEVIGKTPAILRSGRHGVDFYQAIYARLNAQGTWEGEIWNRRKNGEVYPEWLMISSRFDHQGRLEGYVAIFSDITKRKQDEALILKQANYDFVTALPNRSLFSDRLHQALRLSDRNQTQTALLFVDLDRFKYVNDNFGHHIGDQLLQEVAKRLCAEVRRTDTVARLGGDEFAVIVGDLLDMHAVEQIANKILINLAKPFMLDEHEVFISCSIGIAFYPVHGADSDVLIINADSAMYKAKQQGRNMRVYFNNALNEDSNRRREIEIDLHKALRKKEFYLVFQPIWSIDHQKMESVEALIRWNNPNKGMISPGEFIPLAEESSLIHDIGRWVIEDAFRFASLLQQQAANPPKVSLNISSMQFMRGKLDELIIAMLTRYQLPGEAIVLEITESVLMLDQPDIGKQLDALVQQGIQLSIDDFGTGYSSLSYLKKYPIRRIKIDQSFVRDLTTDKGDQTLVAGIISLASSLNMTTTVEGVETHAQLDMLKTYGKPLIQGYLFNRPLKEQALLELLTEHALKR